MKESLGPGSSAERVDRLIRLACDLADAGRHADAIPAFQSAAALGSAEALFDMGNSLTALGRFFEAADAFREAAELGVREAWLNLGNVQSEAGNSKEAIAAYRAAWEADDPHGALALAYELRAVQHQDQADDVLRRAAEAGDLEAAAVLAHWQWDRTLDPALEPALRAGAQHNPAARADLADLLRHSGRIQEARSVLEEGVEHGEVESMLPLGNLYADDLDDDQAAERLYLQGAEAGDPHCHYNLAALLLNRGDRTAAEMHLRLAASAGDALAVRRLKELLQDDD